MQTRPAPRSQVSTPVDARPPRTPARPAAPSLAAPAGSQDILPARMRVRMDLERRLLEAFALAGYERVGLPTWEPFALFGSRYGDRLRERLFTLYSDQEYALRPDFTGSVGRLVASGALEGRPLPLRLSYAGQVFRYERLGDGRSREFRQVGIELVGARGLEADLEVIDLGLEALGGLGLEGLELRLFHAGVLGQALASLVPELEPRLALHGAVLAWHSSPGAAGRAIDLEASPMSHFRPVVGEETLRRLLELSRLEGAAAEIRREYGRLFPDLELPELDHLLAVAELLEASGRTGVRVAPVGVREVGYYNGICFELRLAGGEGELASGGRYDSMVRQPGAPGGGVGLAVHLEALTRAFIAGKGALPAPPRGVVFRAPHTPLPQGMAVAHRLRREGHTTLLELEPAEGAAALERARILEAAWYVVVEQDGMVGVMIGEEGAGAAGPTLELADIETALRWLEGRFDQG